MAILAILFVVGMAVVAGAARVGLAGRAATLLRPVLDLLRIFAQRLWLRDGATYRITITESEAPRLVAVVRELARRLEVIPPRTLVLEMHTGAWVRLDGLRRATGKVTLGVGYDLLAGLSVPEIEAVLAHELGHMRFVQRGFARWLNKGLARLANVTGALDGYNTERRNAGQRSDLANWSYGAFQRLTLRAARLVATCSRQDEFEADHAAAEICGADALRSALLTLEPLETAASLIPWPERVARMQAGDGYAEWLVSELAERLVTLTPDELPKHSIDDYSTHPSLRDRILALPAPAGGPPEPGTALQLLASPDRLASRLAAEIQRVMDEEEKKDTARVARETRRWSRRREIGYLQGLGVLLCVAGVLVGLMLLSPPFDAAGVITAVLCIGLGVAAYLAGAYRDTRPLPIPEYGTLTTWKPYQTLEALEQAEKEIEAELRALANPAGGKRAALNRLIDAAYEALRQRDYLRAHVASRLVTAQAHRRIEGWLGYAIAAGSIGNREQVTQALNVIRERVGFRSPATTWGAAWALVMLEDPSAEGLLLRLVERHPAEATFAGLLALVQLRRQKTSTGIANARKAQALAPGNEAIAKLVIQGLLQAGRAREAAEASARLQDFADQDAQAAFLMVKVRLMAHDMDGAAHWAERLRDLDQDGSWHIALGSAFTEARRFGEATEYYRRAIETRHAPQAHLGLAGLASVTGDRPTARSHCLSALCFDQAGFTGGHNAGSVFHAAVGHLNALAERRITCSAWVCVIPAGTGRFPLDGCSLLVFAENAEQARRHVEEITAAMATETARLDLGTVTWHKAPEDQQPVRPVFPGVQGVLR